MMTRNDQSEPARRRSTYVISTSVAHPKVEKTAKVQRKSGNLDEEQASVNFQKRVFALLVLQYSSILVLTSPFALIESVQVALNTNHHLHLILECIAIGGIVSTLIVAILHGSKYPVTQICLVAMTLFVALEFGLSFAGGSFGGMAFFIAIAQATSSFALILAFLQFDFEWMDWTSAVVGSLIAAGVWIGILLELDGMDSMTAVGIGLGGFAFVCVVLFSSYTVEKHVATDEHILATLFILCPEALLCIGAKSRHVDEDGNGEPLVSESTGAEYT